MANDEACKIIFYSKEDMKRAKAILEANGFELTEQAQFLGDGVDLYAEEL